MPNVEEPEEYGDSVVNMSQEHTSNRANRGSDSDTPQRSKQRLLSPSSSFLLTGSLSNATSSFSPWRRRVYPQQRKN